MRRWIVLVGVLLVAAHSLAPRSCLGEEEGPTHFGLLEAFVDFRATQELGIQWVRGHIMWDDMAQRGPDGAFAWDIFDDDVRGVQLHGFEILGMFIPFAPWDQEKCHAGERMLGPPCDIDGYSRFVGATVERYDGDGIEDMPGLRYPILYWEVFNEPAMKDLPPFYDFTPQDYFELLRATYEEVKAACAQCQVVQGGVAGIAPDKEQFLRSYLALGGGQYFDIASIHFIHSGAFDTFNVEPFKRTLQDYGIDKPIWVTEVQIESGPGADYPYLTDEAAAALLVKGYVRAFALGADKLFYVVLKPTPKFPPNVVVSSLINTHGDKRTTYFAMETMIEKLGSFAGVEELDSGLFKFETPQGPVYVVWNCSRLPEEEFEGKVLLTDILGETRTMLVQDVTVGDTPVFLESVP